MTTLLTGQPQHQTTQGRFPFARCRLPHDRGSSWTSVAVEGSRWQSPVLFPRARSPAVNRLRVVHCMSQCKRPCVIALSGPDRFTYLFGDVEPSYHVNDVRTVTLAYADAERGFLPQHARPEVLCAGVLGRIPPLSFACHLVEPLHIPQRQPVVRKPRTNRSMRTNCHSRSPA